MRLFNRKFVPGVIALGLVAALGACAGGSSDDLPLAPPANGPAADYPITIGDPYTVDGVTYAPQDVWNYDEVGSAALDTAGGTSISASHHTLPLPSYVEVTSLDSGKTILVRVERRGPMDGTQVIALSPAAADQLGIAAGAPVRVRRVNPPEPERAALRAGERAPFRMDTPMSLVSVLRLKLPKDANAAPVSAEPPAAAATENPAVPQATGGPADAAAIDGGKLPTPIEHVAIPPSTVTPEPAPEVEAPAAVPPPTPEPAPAAAKAKAPAPAATERGHLVVQAGAYSTAERADRVARQIGGTVSKSGKLFLVRTGPFAARKDAQASLAKVKAAGYSDARIYPVG